MKITKKALCLLLASVMLLAVLVACKKEQPPVDEQTSDIVSDDVSETTSETEEVWETDINGYVLDNIGKDVNLGGREIRVLMGSYRKDEYLNDGDLGTPIKTAVFSRNQAVQTRLKCKLKFMEEPDGWEKQDSYTQKAIGLASTNEVDMFAVYSLNANGLMIYGLLADLLNNEIIEFDKPWWNSKMVESCSIYDRMYFCTGDIAYSLSDCTYVTLFNKDLSNNLGVPAYLQEKYGVDTFYDLVDDGRWTLDAMMTAAKQFYHDEDGLKNGNDTYGYVTSAVFLDCFWAGSDLRHLEKGNDGSIIISDDMTSYKANNLAAKIVEFMKSPAVSVHGSFAKSEGDPVPQTFWRNNQSLFYTTTLNEYRIENNFEMGVLPVPKYDEDQHEYLSCSGFGYAMWGVCRNSEDRDELFYVLECMASESYRKTVPVFFEQMLLDRQDTEADYKVLQGLRDSIIVDGGRVMDKVFNSMTFYVFRGPLVGGVEYASYYAKYDESLKEQAIALNSLILNMEQLYS